MAKSFISQELLQTFVTDPVYIEGFEQVRLAISIVAAQSEPLQEGIYDVWCDGSSDMYIKVAEDASDVVPTTGYVVKPGNVVPVAVSVGMRIGAVMGTGTGNFCFHKVG